MDKRSTSGMTKAYGRLLAKKEHEKTCRRCSTQSLCQHSDQLAQMTSTELRHAGAEEVETWLKVIEEEQLTLPTAHQRALVARKTAGCLQSTLCCHAGRSNPRSPTLIAVDEPHANKLSTFVQIMSRDVAIAPSSTRGDWHLEDCRHCARPALMSSVTITLTESNWMAPLQQLSPAVKLPGGHYAPLPTTRTFTQMGRTDDDKGWKPPPPLAANNT